MLTGIILKLRSTLTVLWLSNKFYLRINKAFSNENDNPDLSIEKSYINDAYDIIFSEEFYRKDIKSGKACRC